MIYHVVTSRKADRDIAEIVAGLAEWDARWADAWLTRMSVARDELAPDPTPHPVAEQCRSMTYPVRMRLFGKKRNIYCMFFTVVGDTITVLRIRHAARDALAEDDL